MNHQDEHIADLPPQHNKDYKKDSYSYIIESAHMSTTSWYKMPRIDNNNNEVDSVDDISSCNDRLSRVVSSGGNNNSSVTDDDNRSCFTLSSKTNTTTNNPEKLKCRMNDLKVQKKDYRSDSIVDFDNNKMITIITAKQLEELKTADLLHSIIEISNARNPQIQHVRNTSLTYYNWLIVDLCRLIEIVEQRFCREYGESCEGQFRRQLIMKAADKVSFHIPKTCSYGITKDNEFSDYFVPFVRKKREQVLRVIELLEDEICLFAEFIDIKRIGDMKTNEYSSFYHDLLLCKNRTKERLVAATKDMESQFHGDPTKPYKTIKILSLLQSYPSQKNEKKWTTGTVNSSNKWFINHNLSKKQGKRHKMLASTYG
ncbi:hypothetical protein BDA99DRAFT_579695 [Phascolomyces articulosus]|uniref:Uncharacterized protein n=1 Tax=Phascolomyces articulosus TaxID=60185 RepID=A0AAD5PF60_9FUNG|nr:hypothetical protein BDA99DRAFT_579695 [Phascolomyces articulosus]